MTMRSEDDARSLLTRTVAIPGDPASAVRVVTAHETAPERRTPPDEIVTRLDLLARCAAITRAGTACEFLGIANTGAHRFIAISAPTVDELGYLVGDILTKVLSPEDAHTFLQAIERLVAHQAGERREGVRDVGGNDRPA